MKSALLAVYISATLAAQTDAPKDLQLFLLVGQSNMAGRGPIEPADKQPIPRVLMFTEKMEWAPAIDPLHFDKPAVVGVGIGRSFAKVLVDAAPTASVGLIPAAFGGSALNEWCAGCPHYKNAVARAKAAMKSGQLRGILWHQGEADSGKEELARTYRQRFGELVERFRKDLDTPDLPVVAGELGPYFKGQFAGVVNGQLAEAATTIPNCALASAAGLTDKGDSVHFNTASLHEFGQRYAKAFLTLDKKWVAAAAPIAPDLKAYRAARDMKDTRRKVEALEAFERDFPKSAYLESASDMLLSALVNGMPDDKDRILKQASGMYRKASRQERPSMANSIADTMMSVPALLKDAERYARKSVDGLREADFAKDVRARYQKAKLPPPSDAELRPMFAKSRANSVATLGQVYLREGDEARGRRLMEEALAADSEMDEISAELGELAAKRGRDDEALKYLIAARLGGVTKASTVAAFETLFRKTHGGSLDGVEAMLDNEYRKRFPNPVHVEKYAPGPGRTSRMVLAEVFTGAGCSPCAGADVAFDAVMERYARRDVAVLMYHQHIPRPDPMVNPDTESRGRYYDLAAVPTVAVDGQILRGVGGSRANAPMIYARFNPMIEKDLESPVEVKLGLDAAVRAGAVQVQVSADGATDSHVVTLRIVLAEKEVSYSGENFIRFHPMVVRAAKEFSVAAGKPASFHHTFDLAEVTAAALKNLTTLEASGHRGADYHFAVKKHEMDPANLAVVAFLQDDGSHEVLQAAWADLSSRNSQKAAE